MVNQLQQWIASFENSKVGSTKISSLGNGLGLVLEKDAQKNEVVLSIPGKAFLSTGKVLSVSQLKCFSKLCPNLSGNYSVLLALALLITRVNSEHPQNDSDTELVHAKSEAAVWNPYLSLLPTKHSSPVYWPEKILSQASALPAFAQAYEISCALRNSFFGSDESECDGIYAFLKTMYPGMNGESLFELFQWAYGIVESRSFKPIPQNELPVLIPLGDMMNHSSMTNAANVGYRWDYGTGDQISPDSDLALQNGSIIFYAKRFISMGEHLIMKYNDLSSSDELLFYGFCERNNPYNTLPIDLTDLLRQYNPEDKNMALQKEYLLTKSPIGNLSLHHVLDPKCSQAANILLSMRVIVASKEELMQLGDVPWENENSGSSWNNFNTQPLLYGFNDANDALAYNGIRTLIQDWKNKVSTVLSLTLPAESSIMYAEEVHSLISHLEYYFGLKSSEGIDEEGK
jgi:hypothetical protein